MLQLALPHPKTKRKEVRKNDVGLRLPEIQSVKIFGKKNNSTIIEDIELQQELGSGHFGVVYKGLWQGREVALKTVKGEDQLSLMDEANVLKQLRHPNIVNYLGLFIDREGEKYIVMEYVPLGSLDKFVGRKEVTLSDLVNMGKQIACGMAHLESLRVIHRDLALRNILLGVDNGKYVAKISDFGLSRSIENSYYKSDDAHVPIKWCAPEVLQFGTHTTKSDVF